MQDGRDKVPWDHLWEVDHAPVTDDLLPHDRRIERAARAAAARREAHAR